MPLQMSQLPVPSVRVLHTRQNSAPSVVAGATAQLDPLQNSAAFVRGTSDSMRPIWSRIPPGAVVHRYTINDPRFARQTVSSPLQNGRHFVPSDWNGGPRSGGTITLPVRLRTAPATRDSSPVPPLPGASPVPVVVTVAPVSPVAPVLVAAAEAPVVEDAKAPAAPEAPEAPETLEVPETAEAADFSKPEMAGPTSQAEGAPPEAEPKVVQPAAGDDSPVVKRALLLPKGAVEERQDRQDPSEPLSPLSVSSDRVSAAPSGEFPAGKTPAISVKLTTTITPGKPGCCDGLLVSWRYFKDSIVGLLTFRSFTEDREKFEQIVTFLGSVPLFKKQLPTSELPKVAQMLEEHTWKPDEKLVSQGDMGDTFFMIYEGQALLVVRDDQREEHPCGVLSAGDYIGGRANVTEQRHMATVIALGPDTLVTLSMSKKVFEASGLKSQLHFPKRPAIEMGAGGSCNQLSATTPLSPKKFPSGFLPGPMLNDEQQNFIIRSMKNNPNFRAFVDGRSELSHEAMKDIVSDSEIRKVKAGSAAAKFGDLGDEFFVIETGSIEVVITTEKMTAQKSGTSAAAAAAAFSMAGRIRRKQDFLMKLHIPVVDKRKKRLNRSCSVLTKDPRLEEEEESSRKMPAAFRKTTSNEDRSIWAATSLQGFAKRGRACSIDAPEPIEKELSTLHTGDSFGELSLLYNIRREATFRAKEDTTLFVINRKIFKDIAGRDNGRRKFKDYCDLLDEVDVLTPLLRSQRMELAAYANDLVNFEPGCRVLFQGKVRQKPLWYVIHKGSACVNQSSEGGSRTIAELTRGATFGERSLMRAKTTGQCISEVNVDAGASGLTCLTFDGELIYDIFSSLAGNDASLLPSEDCDASEWEQIKSSRSFTKIQCTISLNSLKEVCRLGQGAFGIVFLVEDEDTNKTYALKRVSKGHASRCGTCQSLCWERDLLNMLDSDFLVRLYRTMKDRQFVYFLLEAALGGDLYGMFSSHQEIFLHDEPRGSTSAFYGGCVIAALEHLHERKIIYRDLKPENIMLDCRGYGKVCDMGLARFVVGKTNMQAGTPDYMAPEMIDPPHYHDNSADWWSLGVLMFEMLCQQLPFDDEELEDTGERLLAIRRSQEQRLNFPSRCPPKGQAFTARLLRKLPHRLGAQAGAPEVRSHYFFDSFDFSTLHAQTMMSPVERPWKGKDDGNQPEVRSPWLRGSWCLSPGEEEIFEAYADDGSGWDQEF